MLNKSLDFSNYNLAQLTTDTIMLNVFGVLHKIKFLW